MPGEKKPGPGVKDDDKDEALRDRGAELDIEDRSSMDKDELIDALRNH